MEGDSEGFSKLWGDICIIMSSTTMSEVPDPHPIYPTLTTLFKTMKIYLGNLQVCPPKKDYDHAIYLQDHSNIPNIRPYRHPYYQKFEIEKFVQEMLGARIIRPNTNHYSSPIILVKEKDGGWRFCVDYRALNKITIPDKFLIPIIEELLDEQGGA